MPSDEREAEREIEIHRERIRRLGDRGLSETFRAASVLSPQAQDQIRKRWWEAVGEIGVELIRGGRAVLRRPGRSYRVEVQWAVKGSDIRVSEVQILEEGTEGIEGGGVAPDIGQYLAALRLHTRSGHPIRGPLPGQRPMPGKAQNVRFYERLLADYEALIAKGHAAPAKELARRYKAKHPTVKTWLWRARELRRKGASG